MDNLPEEILFKILEYVIIFKIEKGINNINNICLVNKKFNKCITNKYFWKYILKELNLFDIFQKYIKYHTTNNFKIIIDKYLLLKKTPKEIFQIFSIKEIIKIPFNYNKFYNLLWDITPELFSHPIMIGYDYNNNFYISFKYKSIIDNIEYIEMIYKQSNKNSYRWTICGTGSYIFNSSFVDNNNNNNNNKIKNNIFNDNTIKYIKKLINGKAGIIYNIFNYDKYIWKEDTKNKLILI